MAAKFGRTGPSHPGEILSEIVFPALGRPETEIASGLGISPPELRAVLEGAVLTAEFAYRLAKLTDGDAGLWLRLQANYDASRALRA